MEPQHICEKNMICIYQKCYTKTLYCKNCCNKYHLHHQSHTMPFEKWIQLLTNFWVNWKVGYESQPIMLTMDLLQLLENNLINSIKILKQMLNNESIELQIYNKLDYICNQISYSDDVVVEALKIRQYFNFDVQNEVVELAQNKEETGDENNNEEDKQLKLMQISGKLKITIDQQLSNLYANIRSISQNINSHFQLKKQLVVTNDLENNNFDLEKTEQQTFINNKKKQIRRKKLKFTRVKNSKKMRELHNKNNNNFQDDDAEVENKRKENANNSLRNKIKKDYDEDSDDKKKVKKEQDSDQDMEDSSSSDKESNEEESSSKSDSSSDKGKKNNSILNKTDHLKNKRHNQSGQSKIQFKKEENVKEEDSEESDFEIEEKMVKKQKNNEGKERIIINNSNNQPRQITKLELEKRLKILKEALTVGNIYRTAQKYKMHPSLLRRWRKQYENMPEIIGLSKYYDKHFSKTNKYSEQQKKQIVIESLQPGNKLKTSQKYGIHIATIKRWEMNFGKDLYNSLNTNNKNSNTNKRNTRKNDTLTDQSDDVKSEEEDEDEEEKTNKNLSDSEDDIKRKNGKKNKKNKESNSSDSSSKSDESSSSVEDDEDQEISNERVKNNNNKKSKIDSKTNNNDKSEQIEIVSQESSESDNKSKKQQHLYNFCLVNFPQDQEDKFNNVCSLDHALACNYKDKVKVFLRREQDDKFTQFCSFQHSDSEPIVKLKNFSQYLALCSNYMLEVWKWNTKSLINKKRVESKIEDFCLYKRSKQLKDNFIILQTSAKEIQILNAKTFNVFKKIELTRQMQVKCLQLVDEYVNQIDRGKLIFGGQHNITFYKFYSQTFVDLELENDNIKFIEKYNSQNVVMTTNQNKVLLVNYRYKKIVLQKQFNFEIISIKAKTLKRKGMHIVFLANPTGIVILRSEKLDFLREINITQGSLTSHNFCFFSDYKCKFKFFIVLSKGSKNVITYAVNLNNFF